MERGNDKKIYWVVLINYFGQVHRFEPEEKTATAAKNAAKYGLAKKLGVNLRLINNYFAAEKNNISVERRMI